MTREQEQRVRDLLHNSHKLVEEDVKSAGAEKDKVSQ